MPDGKEVARKLKVQAARFVLIKGILYKRGFSRPYLRCLILDEANYVMREVHKRVYRNHSRSRSLVHKLIWVGYYWPTMQKDATAYVKACDKCQRFAKLIRQLSEELTPMTAPMAFRVIGVEHHGSIPNNNSTTKIPGGQYRLLHQVGGSRSTGHHHGEKCAKFCMEEHRLQVWYTQSAGLRQREAV